MRYLKACIIAFATYSRLPMPRVAWERRNLELAPAFLPLVGAVIAGGEFLLFWGGGLLGLPAVVLALLAAALPILVTGGIHLDGFLDTKDALHSYKSREEKLEILKDSHVGAFAVIRLALYLLVFIAAAVELAELSNTAVNLTTAATQLSSTSVRLPAATTQRPSAAAQFPTTATQLSSITAQLPATSTEHPATNAGLSVANELPVIVENRLLSDSPEGVPMALLATSYAPSLLRKMLGSPRGILLTSLLAFVLARILAAFALILGKSARRDGLAQTFASAADRRVCICLLAVEGGLALLLAALCSPLTALLELAFLAFFYLRFWKMATREFEGFTGDLLGYAITEMELCGMLAGAISAVAFLTLL